MIDKESIRIDSSDSLRVIELSNGLPYKRQRTRVDNNNEATLSQPLASRPYTGFNPPLIKIITSPSKPDIKMQATEIP